MIFKKEDIRIGMRATSRPRGRIVKIVNVYTSCTLFSSLQLLRSGTVAAVQVTVQRGGVAQCFCPRATLDWETVHRALP